MYWLVLGIFLVGSGGAVAAVAQFSPDALGQLTQLILYIAGVLNMAVGSVVMALPFVQRSKSSDGEVIRSPKWHVHEIQTKLFIVDEKIETITTKSGTAFVQRVRLKSRKTGKHAAEFTIVKIFDKAFWKFGSATELCIGPRRPVQFNEGIESERIRSLLSGVKVVLCLGLASSAEGSAENSAGLSIRRANRLEDWLRFSAVMIERDVRIRSVPMGQARTKTKKDSPEERAQRTAVLLGLAFDNELISEESAMEELTRLTRLEAVRLDDYPAALRSTTGSM